MLYYGRIARSWSFDMCVPCVCRASMTEDDVTAAIERRAEARKSKDYEKADSVRAELSKKGIAIMDTPAGVEWRPTTPEKQA